MITLFEKFVEQDYFDFTKKEQKKLIAKFGNKNIEKFAAEGDLDGLKFLLKNGYDMNAVDSENLLALALNNNQMKMFDFLTKSGYGQGPNGFKNGVDCISLPDIIGRSEDQNPHKINDEHVRRLKIITKYGYDFGRSEDQNPHKINDEQVRRLKIITKYGYDFGFDGKHNLIQLYLCTQKYNRKTNIYVHLLIEGAEPFIDWLLENYPDNYKLLRNIELPESLIKKHEHLVKSDKYNL